MPKINVGRIESYMRVLLGTLIVTIGSHGLWLLIPVGLLVMGTGISCYCPISQALNIHTRAAKENYYLSYLPRYDPNPLFVFYKNGTLAFANQAAKTVFPGITIIGDLIANNQHDICSSVSENEFSNITIRGNDERTYTVTLRGSREIDAVIVYAHDVTELIKLDQEIISTQKEIVYIMGEIGETRSRETGHHVRRVAEYSYLLAKKYGFTEEDATLLKLASPMHDIGKVAIPDAILNKPDKLDPDEFEIMKTHAQIGFEMLARSERPILKTAAIIANEHHEKWDGTGYPNSTSGDNIHIYGRITALADVFDALGSKRVYKMPWSLEKIIVFLRKEKGKHFEPQLVQILIDNLEEFLEIRDRYQDHLPATL